MKRKSGLYDKIISLENLRQADKIARRGKLKQYGVKKHLEDAETNLIWLHELLNHRKFETSKYSVYEIAYPKHRVIARLPYYPDRILQHTIILQIGTILTKTFTADSYSCVKGRGILKASMNLRKALQDDNYNKYCLKLDIKKFYENIDHSILKWLLRKKFKDKELFSLLDEIIDSNPKGLPLGSLLSQYLANFYLCYLDHFIKQKLKVKYYFKYMDDLVILGNNKKELHYFLAEIRKYLKELKLEVKENYQIFEVEDRGIDFLGFIHRKDYTLIRKRIKKNYIKSKNKERWNSWLVHCNSINLRNKYENNN